MNGMENRQPLLSICIPTYNRAGYLEETLKNIISDDAFSLKVEIIISDNASVDHTQQLCEEYALKYKNIIYYRNEENVRDENFFLALNRGRGKYLRLCNDTLHLKKGSLDRMLRQIEITSEDTPLLFIQNIPFLNNVNVQKMVIGKQGLVENLSFWITWIGNFGVWRKSLDAINNPNRYAKLQLAQVDWFFQLLSNDKALIFFGDFFDSIYPNKKGGYNFFYVFIVNYLFLIRKNVSNVFVIEKEKYRLFRYHILPFYYRLFFLKQDEFDIVGAHSIIMKYYWYCPYMYLGLLCVRLGVLLKKRI